MRFGILIALSCVAVASAGVVNVTRCGGVVSYLRKLNHCCVKFMSCTVLLVAETGQNLLLDGYIYLLPTISDFSTRWDEFLHNGGNKIFRGREEEFYDNFWLSYKFARFRKLFVRGLYAKLAWYI